MKRLLKRLHQNKVGFTLIELLVVIAILAVLAAIALPNFAGIIGNGETQAADAERATVQTAMDTMMTNLHLSSVNATAETDDMSGFPTGYPLYPNYMRSSETTGTYSCDTTGLVTRESTGY